MGKTKPEQKPLRPGAGEAPGGDWFYDELMTAQPDATREFFRARLRAAPAPAIADKAKR